MASQLIARNVACETATGTVYDYGAHVTAWQPRSEQPVIWTPKSFLPADGQPLRGGIPICFPWFGPGPDGNLTPPHGLARVSRWLLIDSFVDEAAGTHQLTYRLTPKRLGNEEWNFEAVMCVSFGRELDITLSITNKADHDHTFEAALHTYIAVGDIRKVVVLGLDDDPYLDFVANPPQANVQSLELTFDGTTIDRVYRSTAPVTVEDPNNARRIVIRKTGSANTVVWNPGQKGCQGKVDLSPTDWQHFVCIEAASCKDDAVTLAPGQTHVLGQHISIEHL